MNDTKIPFKMIFENLKIFKKLDPQKTPPFLLTYPHKIIIFFNFWKHYFKASFGIIFYSIDWLSKFIKFLGEKKIFKNGGGLVVKVKKN